MNGTLTAGAMRDAAGWVPGRMRPLAPRLARRVAAEYRRVRLLPDVGMVRVPLAPSERLDQVIPDRRPEARQGVLAAHAITVRLLARRLRAELGAGAGVFE